jgi:hypothetical protein
MYFHFEDGKQGLMFWEGWLLQALLPGHQGSRIFTLWSGSPRQNQQVPAQARRVLRTRGGCFWSSHGHAEPLHSARERSKTHAAQVRTVLTEGIRVDQRYSRGRSLRLDCGR